MGIFQAKEALYQICQEDGSGDEQEVKKILDKISFLNKLDINKQNKDGKTALHRASSKGCTYAAQLLLSQDGIDINKKDKYGCTALHYASSNGYKYIAELLLSQGTININEEDKSGWTALHSASANGSKDVTELLLSHDTIDITIRNHDWKLASEICCDKIGNKSYKPMILEAFKNHKKSLKLSATTKTPLHKEGIPSGSSIPKRPQDDLKRSKIVEEVKKWELNPLVEEKENLKQQIQSLEEKMKEMTSHMKT